MKRFGMCGAPIFHEMIAFFCEGSVVAVEPYMGERPLLIDFLQNGTIVAVRDQQLRELFQRFDHELYGRVSEEGVLVRLQLFRRKNEHTHNLIAMLR